MEKLKKQALVLARIALGDKLEDFRESPRDIAEMFDLQYGADNVIDGIDMLHAWLKEKAEHMLADMFVREMDR